MSALPFVLSVTTLGRVDALRTLLQSLVGQLEQGDAIVLVAQANVDEVKALAAEYAPMMSGRLGVIESARGASRGRNAGVAFAEVADALLMFPNDTTWFPAGSIDRIRAAMGDAPAGAVAVITASGPRFALPAEGEILDRHTVWRVIEMGLVIRSPLFAEVGGFDAVIGTGAPSPWQAGEITDLLLRALRTRPDVATRFAWIHDDGAHVGGVAEGAGLSPRERSWKLRAYGRGVGHVYRTHGYSWWERWAFAAAGLLIGIRRRREYRMRDGVPALLGRLEGITGRVGAAALDHHAVSR